MNCDQNNNEPLSALLANFVITHITIAHKSFVLLFQQLAWPSSLL